MWVLYHTDCNFVIPDLVVLSFKSGVCTLRLMMVSVPNHSVVLYFIVWFVLAKSMVLYLESV